MLSSVDSKYHNMHFHICYHLRHSLSVYFNDNFMSCKNYITEPNILHLKLLYSKSYYVLCPWVNDIQLLLHWIILYASSIILILLCLELFCALYSYECITVAWLGMHICTKTTYRMHTHWKQCSAHCFHGWMHKEIITLQFKDVVIT